MERQVLLQTLTDRTVTVQKLGKWFNEKSNTVNLRCCNRSRRHIVLSTTVSVARNMFCLGFHIVRSDLIADYIQEFSCRTQMHPKSIHLNVYPVKVIFVRVLTSFIRPITKIDQEVLWFTHVSSPIRNMHGQHHPSKMNVSRM